mgnify:CR=1 FL=1
MVNLSTDITPFVQKLGQPLTKKKITTLQINLGKKCNLACNHCHVESSPLRTEELSPEICQQLQQLITAFPQIKTVDLTGGAPEINYGFHDLVESAVQAGKEVIVRSNLTIFFESGWEYLPNYFAANKLRVIASLPCYLEDNVDKQRGKGVYQQSIQAIAILNELGYGIKPDLILDLVYNPPIPNDNKFSLTPNQLKLQQDYQNYLKQEYNLSFNNLFTITNLPIGRVKIRLEKQEIYQEYLRFLETHHNPVTVSNLMCRNQLSVDYLGNIYDCDFNQMENIPVVSQNGQKLTVKDLLTAENLDIIDEIKTAKYCYGCTAGSGSSCGGALIE